MDTTNMLPEVTATGTVAVPQTNPEPAVPTLADVMGANAAGDKAG